MITEKNDMQQATPSQKHGLIEQWTMTEETIEKYREINSFRKDYRGFSFTSIISTPGIISFVHFLHVIPCVIIKHFLWQICILSYWVLLLHTFAVSGGAGSHRAQYSQPRGVPPPKNVRSHLEGRKLHFLTTPPPRFFFLFLPILQKITSLPFSNV